MAQSFSITAANTECTLGAGRQAEAAFTLTNNTSRTLRGLLKVRPLGQTKGGWFGFAGERERSPQMEREFASGTHQVKLNVNVPTDTPAGQYKFRIDAIYADQPDDDYTEGQVVSIDIPAATAPPPPPRMPLMLIAAAVAVIVVGIGGWLLIFNGPKVPGDLVGQPFDAASSKLTAAGLVPEKTTVTSDKPAGTVVDTKPAPGERVKKGTQVVLSIAQAAAPASSPKPVISRDFSTAAVIGGGVSLDYCKDWATNCGQPAADAFCQAQGMKIATLIVVMRNHPPTQVLGTHQRCATNNCTAITDVRCTTDVSPMTRILAAKNIHTALALQGLVPKQ
ncbi:PASTA domain-containing protein [Caballeronia sp. ATUFL_M2_KS44]|uniref:PASTA domain-containing protein n=1 Tax=Caballeronia sp. ATUFL_M2_KS44 TaxID=2921767 RepID=UPI0020284049|nr:PASTA domain-containing protein [Caballeronia sp. ATUFL_M2_KS44]